MLRSWVVGLGVAVTCAVGVVDAMSMANVTGDGVDSSSGGTMVQTLYWDAKCSGTPAVMSFIKIPNCNSMSCSESIDDGSKAYMTVGCTDNALTFATTAFGSSPFVYIEFYNEKCATLATSAAILADGSCHTLTSTNTSLQATLFANNSVSVATFTDTRCSTVRNRTSVDSASLNGSTCVGNTIKLYAGGKVSSSTSKAGSSSGKSAASKSSKSGSKAHGSSTNTSTGSKKSTTSSNTLAYSIGFGAFVVALMVL